MKRWDVAVIGAGPAGSYTAAHLARQGLRVILLEEHALVGEPRHCTGVLSCEAYEQFPDLPRHVIQSELHAAWIVSPSGERLRTEWFDRQAYVIQRTRFDQALMEQAIQAGAMLQMNSPVNCLHPYPTGVSLLIKRSHSSVEEIHASMAVVATGISYRLHHQLDLLPPASHLHCAQVEVEAQGIDEVEVFIGRHIAPGSFAWAVPLGNRRARIGVTAHRMAAQSLVHLMQSPLLRERINAPDLREIRKRPVPIRPVHRSVSDRVLLVGDAAGQVKPTTGGGIYYGLIGASAAAQTTLKAFNAGRFDRSFLMAYDRSWKKKLWKEMLFERVGRRVFESLSDERLDRLVHICKHPGISSWIDESALFDWHGRMVLSFLMTPRVWSQLF